jgi:hypothetical protein
MDNRFWRKKIDAALYWKIRIILDVFRLWLWIIWEWFRGGPHHLL